MKVAVIGASGFVGGHVLRFLRAAGHQTRAVVRNPRALHADPDRRLADACDVYALRDALDGCECVVHAALGPPHVILGSLAPIYAAAEAVGARRLIYISTGSVHGQCPPPDTDERSPLTVRQPFPYNTAKIRAERKLRRLRARGTVELVMLRPTIVYGPGSRWIFEFADGLCNGTAYVVDGARGICNSIYVDNLGHAIGLALATPEIDGEVFLVNDEDVVTWRDLYRPIAHAFGVDIDRVPSFSAPDLSLTFAQRYVDPIRSSELTHRVSALAPRPLKNAIKRAYRLARRLAGSPAGAVGPADERRPTVTREMAALHSCRWRLPHTKARRVLGYVAPISFDDGIERSVEWLLSRERLRA
jgi:nucleoside-diphosphate-sugar epimerase